MLNVDAAWVDVRSESPTMWDRVNLDLCIGKGTVNEAVMASYVALFKSAGHIILCLYLTS